jgi:hypothetical protein
MGEPGRFDDVDIRFVEEPEPPRRHSSLRRRMTVALSAWILAAGVLAAAASALTESNNGSAAGKAAKSATAERYHGTLFKRDGRECRAGKAHRSSSSTAYSQSDF